MTPGPLSRKVVAERSEWIRDMLERIRALPLGSPEEFTTDTRSVDAAESCLRRALEALLDLGRHVLAKGFADAPTEYKEVAVRLGERGVLDPDETALLAKMAGYRNRLVHFYDEVSAAELFQICTERLPEVERVLGGIHRWIQADPARIEAAP